MASSFVDVCRFLPTAGGTSDWTYSSAVQGYQSPTAAGVVNGATYSYRAESADLSQWEIGSGAYNSGTGVFSRTTVLFNSSASGTGAGQSGAGTKISFTVAPQVAVVALAEDLLLFNAAMSLTDGQKAQGRSNIGAGYGFRNRLINADFFIDQRTSGAALTLGTSSAYGVDRWLAFRGTNVSTAQRNLTGGPTVAAGGANIPSFYRMQRTAADTGTGVISLGQIIESRNMVDLAGQPVVISFYARAGANYSAASSALSAQLRTGTTADEGNAGFTAGSWAGFASTISQTATLTTSWQRFQYTATMPTGALEAGIYFTTTPVGTAGAADYFDVTGVQVEFGSAATDFEFRHNAAELALAYRYYYRRNAVSSTEPLNIMAAFSTTQAWGPGVNLPVTMRISPTVALSAIGDINLNGNACSAGTFDSASPSLLSTFTGLTTAAVLTSGFAVILRFNTSSGWIGASAEL